VAVGVLITALIGTHGESLHETMQELTVEHVHFSSAIFLPSGTDFAQAVECSFPTSILWGAFLAVNGDGAS